ncbi:MAG TPA: heterodisulfide reductase-related iron-sulfur binding cluster [Candidatus Acidoferrales bacterium]|nr:heterodisulfide reductase-related iron-sulfur binding cluster [Candidatus Acidoferrales bacterium]
MGVLLAAEPTRQIQWGVNAAMVDFMYASMTVALLVFSYGVWRRIRVWRLGRPAARFDHPLERGLGVLREILGHTRLVRDRAAGIVHWLVFFGIAVLFMATVVVFIQHDLGIGIMRGAFYLYFESLTVDVFGVFAIVGVAAFVVRRYVIRVGRLGPSEPADALLAAALLLILCTGYLLQGSRIAATHDPWGLWSPAGYLVSLLLGRLWSPAQLELVHGWVWTFHVALWHTVLAVIPFTRLFHLVMAPVNLYFRALGAPGVPAAIDFESEAAIGLASALDLSWKQLMDLDACVACGRCEAVCPAFAEGKPLSPRSVVLDLRQHVRENSRVLRRARRAAPGERESLTQGLPRLAGGVIKEEAIWACTTCRACEDACPVGVEHLSLILPLRRDLAMEQMRVPDGVREMVVSLEDRQQPFRGASAARADWYQDLGVRQLSDVADPSQLEVVYWAGCAVLSSPRVASVARAVVKLLQAAEVDFAVVGAQEVCCGDPARRSGNEFHYDQLARQNRPTLASIGDARVLTHCPHCLQALGAEYRQMGLVLKSVHHTELIQELIDSGRLHLTRPLASTVTFHDPCYLSRYRGQTQAPREALAAGGLRLLEMARSGRDSFCCGSGGSHAFFRDPVGRINRNRAEQALKTGAETVCTACPFCLTMMEEGVEVARPGGGVPVRDVAELVLEALI